MLRKILFNRFFILSLLTIIVQQSVVSSSTIWLAQIIERLNHGEDFRTFLWLFLISMAVPTLLGFFIGIFNTKWRLTSYASLIATYETQYFGRLKLWRDRKTKEQANTFLNNEALSIVDGFVPFISDLIATSLNVIFNVITIVYAVDSGFLAAYLVSLVIIFVTTIVSRKSLETKTADAQAAKVKFNDRLLKSWDNIVLANTYCHTNWNKSIHCTFKDFSTLEFRQYVASNLTSHAMSLLALSPVIIALIHMVYLNSNNSSYLLILFSSLMRQIIVLNHMTIVVHYIVESTRFSSRLSGLKNMLNLSRSEPMAGIINWSLLDFSIGNQKLNLTDIDDLSRRIQSQQLTSGRITLRGSNGAGKSTCLLALKTEHRNEAFYLPPASDLEFASAESSSSTGEKLKGALLEIISEVSAPIVLLDEWDANLDEDNKLHLSQLIDQLAQSKLVIEIRHGLKLKGTK